MPGLLFGIAVWLGWEAWAFLDEEKKNGDRYHQTVSDAVWEVRDSSRFMGVLIRGALVAAAYHFGWCKRSLSEPS